MKYYANIEYAWGELCNHSMLNISRWHCIRQLANISTLSNISSEFFHAYVCMKKLQKEQPAQGSIIFTKETASKQYHKLIQLQNLDQMSTSKSRPNFSLWFYKKAWRQRVYIAQAISVFAFFPLFCANFNAPLYPVDSASNPCWIKEILHFISFNVGCNTYEEKNCTFWYIASSIPKSNFETVITETAFILTCHHGPGNLYHRLERL